jgi:hypothetical protein
MLASFRNVAPLSRLRPVPNRPFVITAYAGFCFDCQARRKRTLTSFASRFHLSTTID